MTSFYLIAFYLLDWEKKILFQVSRIWSFLNVADLSVNCTTFFWGGVAT